MSSPNISNKTRINLPKYSLSEEIINAITHGVGVIFGVVAMIFLLMNCEHNLRNILCFSVYGVSIVVLYTISTLYHALKISRAKAIFRKLDHCSIFLLIAGTYTPISLLLIKGTLGVIVLSVIWGVAVLGIILNSISVNKFSKFSFACYLVMGWTAVLVIKPLLQHSSKLQIWWLFIGGAMYTLGAIIYMVGKKVKYMHSIWHIFVLLGSMAHFAMFFS